MLNEICADLAVVKTLTQTAESEVEVGKYGSISFLDDELIQEGKTVRKRVLISTGPVGREQVRKRGLPPLLRERGQATLPDLFYFQGGGDAFEIDAGGVTGGV